MLVAAVSSVGGGYIDPLLIERYAVLNAEIRRKRLEKQRGVDPLIGANHPRVETVQEPAMSPEELRKMYANPVLAQVPIHIAYKIMQRICDDYEYYYPGEWRDKTKLYE